MTALFLASATQYLQRAPFFDFWIRQLREILKTIFILISQFAVSYQQLLFWRENLNLNQVSIFCFKYLSFQFVITLCLYNMKYQKYQWC